MHGSGSIEPGTRSLRQTSTLVVSRVFSCGVPSPDIVACGNSYIRTITMGVINVRASNNLPNRNTKKWTGDIKDN